MDKKRESEGEMITMETRLEEIESNPCIRRDIQYILYNLKEWGATSISELEKMPDSDIFSAPNMGLDRMNRLCVVLELIHQNGEINISLFNLLMTISKIDFNTWIEEHLPCEENRES